MEAVVRITMDTDATGTRSTMAAPPGSGREAWHTWPVARAVDAPVDARTDRGGLSPSYAALDLAS